MLYTNSGQPLKQMVCPRDESWQQMVQEGKAEVRRCSQCLHVDLEQSPIQEISHAP